MSKSRRQIVERAAIDERHGLGCRDIQRVDDACPPPRPVAAVPWIRQQHDASVRRRRHVVRPGGRRRAIEARSEWHGGRHRAEIRQRDARQEVTGWSDERDRKRAAVRPDPGDVSRFAGAESSEARDLGRLGRTLPAVADLRRERALEGVLERGRGHHLVGRRREAVAAANVERVRAAAIGDSRHRRRDLGPKAHRALAGHVRISEEARAGGGFELLVGGRVRDRRVERQVDTWKREPQLRSAGRRQRRRCGDRRGPEDPAAICDRCWNRTDGDASSFP